MRDHRVAESLPVDEDDAGLDAGGERHRLSSEPARGDEGTTSSSHAVGGPDESLDSWTTDRPSVFATTADWSRVNNRIVHSALPRSDAAGTDLFSINPDGSGPIRLTHFARKRRSAIHPSFARDGETVVFVGREELMLQVDPRSRTVSPAFADNTTGLHPRPRPTGEG